MKAFVTELEFNQASLDNVARMICDKASEVISNGNVADIAEECLRYLELVAVKNELQPFVVLTYLEIVEGENEEIRNFL